MKIKKYLSTSIISLLCLSCTTFADTNVIFYNYGISELTIINEFYQGKLEIQSFTLPNYRETSAKLISSNNAVKGRIKLTGKNGELIEIEVDIQDNIPRPSCTGNRFILGNQLIKMTCQMNYVKETNTLGFLIIAHVEKLGKGE